MVLCIWTKLVLFTYTAVCLLWYYGSYLIYTNNSLGILNKKLKLNATCRVLSNSKNYKCCFLALIFRMTSIWKIKTECYKTVFWKMAFSNKYFYTKTEKSKARNLQNTQFPISFKFFVNKYFCKPKIFCVYLFGNNRGLVNTSHIY